MLASAMRRSLGWLPRSQAKSRLQYAELQLNRTAYLTRSDTALQQALDQAKNDAASAQADVAEDPT
jgi:HlyD family secretion protein